MVRSLQLEDRGPSYTAEMIKERAAEEGLLLPTDVCVFLADHGNGGYLQQSLYVYAGDPPRPAYEVRALHGVDHQLTDLAITSVVSDFRTEGVLPAGIIPIFSDSGGSCLCWTTSPLSGCRIVFWSPFDGEPEKLEPVAVDFDDLLDRLEPLK